MYIETMGMKDLHKVLTLFIIIIWKPLQWNKTYAKGWVRNDDYNW